MKFVFLILALGLLALPLFFHLHKKIFKDGILKAALRASFISAVVFSAVVITLQERGTLLFDIAHTTGMVLAGVPLEQYLLNFTFGFAAIGLYYYLNIRFPKNNLQKYSLAFSNLLLGLCIAFLFFGYTKWYTLLTFSTLLLVLLFIEYVGRLRFMYRAYRTFAVMLLPFYVVYAVLFGMGIIAANPQELVGMYVLKIPIESHFMALSLILLGIYLFEFYRKRSIS